MRSYFRRIQKLLNENEWQVWIDNDLMVDDIPAAGFCDRDDLTIYINPTMGDSVTTLIHECLHVLHPDWKNGKVESKAVRIYNRLDDKEKWILDDYIQVQSGLGGVD